jgi:hypothetical protein
LVGPSRNASGLRRTEGFRLQGRKNLLPTGGKGSLSASFIMQLAPMPKSLDLTHGYEEEFFLIEEGRLHPTLQSLDCLRKLYWRNPVRYRERLASNFARGADRKLCWMSSIEVSTNVHRSPESLVAELKEWRRDIALASRGSLCVPIGAPLALDAPSNTAGAHIHVGVPASERDRVFANLGHFLPVLAVASMNSPTIGMENPPKSYRMACNFASGDMREDREYRFQDLIVSKRLGTVEIRALDPIPDASRLLQILNAVVAIATHPETLPFDREAYNALRPSWAVQGMTEHVEKLLDELQPIYPLSKELLIRTQGDLLAEAAARSPEEAYRLVDSVWRDGTGVEATLRPHARWRSWSGILGYYSVQLPWMAYKGYKEWHGHTPDASRKSNGAKAGRKARKTAVKEVI